MSLLSSVHLQVSKRKEAKNLLQLKFSLQLYGNYALSTVLFTMVNMATRQTHVILTFKSAYHTYLNINEAH